MNRRFLFNTRWLLLALGTGLLAGCVDRHYVILTNVPGAIVLENNKYVGPAPVTRPFQYYGKYRFRLLANGYEEKVVDECFKTPWYEYFPLDFIAENLIPWIIRDVRVLEGPAYTLEPIQVVPPDVVKARAEDMRFKAKDIGIPLPPPPLPPGAVLPPVQGPPPAQMAPPVEVAPSPARLSPAPGQPAVGAPQVQSLPPAGRDPLAPTPTWTPNR